MKTLLLALSLFGFVSLPAMADGYSFDPTTQEVWSPTLRVRLSVPQIEQLSATGLVDLTEEQLILIHRFYPKANKTQSVVTATFNDNNEDLTVEDVHVFWVSAEEIAVTLNPKVFAAKNLQESALAEPGYPNLTDIRIAPYGQIYIAGKRSTFKDALEVIARLSVEPGLTHRQVSVTVAPPYRSDEYSWKLDPDGELKGQVTLNQEVADLFNALSKYGEAHAVIVAKSW